MNVNFSTLLTFLMCVSWRIYSMMLLIPFVLSTLQRYKKVLIYANNLGKKITDIIKKYYISYQQYDKIKRELNELIIKSINYYLFIFDSIK
jgi:hypothetical protein